MASTLSLGFWGLRMRRVISVGLTLPGEGRSNRPYLRAELISTASAPVHPRPANVAASRSVHSFPALFSSTACGIRRHLRMGCLGKTIGPNFVVPPAFFLADFFLAAFFLALPFA